MRQPTPEMGEVGAIELGNRHSDHAGGVINDPSGGGLYLAAHMVWGKMVEAALK
jgi:hypothetical protein